MGKARAIEFVADEPGDWAFHCHKSHHTMNAMSHSVPTMIGVEQRDIAKKIGGLVPEYMVMGDKGMADMGSMEMALPNNTLPMHNGLSLPRRNRKAKTRKGDHAGHDFCCDSLSMLPTFQRKNCWYVALIHSRL